jgi:hypothetical protein
MEGIALKLNIKLLERQINQIMCSSWMNNILEHIIQLELWFQKHVKNTWMRRHLVCF